MIGSRSDRLPERRHSSSWEMAGNRASPAIEASQVAQPGRVRTASRALRAAVAIDPRAAGEVPSTKGQLGG